MTEKTGPARTDLGRVTAEFLGFDPVHLTPDRRRLVADALRRGRRMARSMPDPFHTIARTCTPDEFEIEWVRPYQEPAE